MAQKFPRSAEMNAMPTHQITHIKIDAKLLIGFGLLKYPVSNMSPKTNIDRILIELIG